eukprot:1137619-Pelagomonas_calceolata.AAC.3
METCHAHPLTFNCILFLFVPAVRGRIAVTRSGADKEKAVPRQSIGEKSTTKVTYEHNPAPEQKFAPERACKAPEIKVVKGNEYSLPGQA